MVAGPSRTTSVGRPEYPGLVVLRPDQLDLARRCSSCTSSIRSRYAWRSGAAIFRASSSRASSPAPRTGCPRPRPRSPICPRCLGTALGYSLEVEDGFCVQVRNASIRRLRVTLVNCAASGKVELLGDQVIDPRSYYRFWRGNVQGSPFVASEVRGQPPIHRPDGGHRHDREDKDLRYSAQRHTVLRHPQSVAGSGEGRRGTAARRTLLEKWTATEVVIGVGITGQATA